MSHLEITEVVLLYCNVINNNYQSEAFYIHFSQISHLANY